MATNAQRQAAYRKRRRSVIDEILAQRGLPTLPAIASIPGWPRWKEAMERIVYQMQMVEDEMSDYYDQRSDRWQESERADRFQESLDALRVVIETAQGWPD
jgi:hypothetical protein